METPILFRCPDCFIYTVISDNQTIYFTPNFCGHCGAENPATR